jgi:hypothetical protein
MEPTIWVVLAAGVGAAAAAAYGLLRARRQRNEKQTLKTEIRKWEDEGGNVPQVPTVSPVETPAASEPAARKR